LALVEVSPVGPEHDVVRYVARPFDNIDLPTIVRGAQFKWAEAWASGREPW
jgi:hypothetical protein